MKNIVKKLAHTTALLSLTAVLCFTAFSAEARPYPYAQQQPQPGTTPPATPPATTEPGWYIALRCWARFGLECALDACSPAAPAPAVPAAPPVTPPAAPATPAPGGIYKPGACDLYDAPDSSCCPALS